MRCDPGSIGYEVLRSRQRSHSLMDWIRFLWAGINSWSRRDMMLNKILRTGMYLFLALILAWELLALSASAKGSGLERIYADPDGTWYINAKTMVSPASDKISFWSTFVPVKGGDNFSRIVSVLEKARKNPLRLEYVQTLQEVNCLTKKISTSNILYYDKLDRIVHTVNVPPSSQQAESSGPATEQLLAAVCTSQLAQVMGE